MKKTMLVLTATLLATFPLGVFLPSNASATDGDIYQRILPLECVFQIVNDGSNTIIYVTPEECGVVIPPDPDPEPEPEEPENPVNPTTPEIPDGSTVLPPTRIQTGTGIIQTPGLVIPNGPLGFEAARELPFEPVAVLQSSEEVEASTRIANVSAGVAAVIVGLAALGLIILIALA